MKFLGLRRQRAGQSHDVGLAERTREVGLGKDLIGGVGRWPCRAAHPDHTHIEGASEPGETCADAAEPDDHQSLSAELLLAPGAVADHSAPKRLPLVVAREMKLPREGEDESDRMFRHRAFIHALGIGQPYAALGEQRLVILIRAGAERLHKP